MSYLYSTKRVVEWKECGEVLTPHVSTDSFAKELLAKVLLACLPAAYSVFASHVSLLWHNILYRAAGHPGVSAVFDRHHRCNLQRWQCL